MRSTGLLAGIVVLVGTFVGCTSNGLVDDLAAKNVSRRTTARIDLVGDEATVGSRVRVEIRDPDVIDAFWAKISKSYPYELWYASSYRTIEFYIDGESAQPDAVISLNESGLAFVRDAERWHFDEATKKMTGGYRCVGLHELVMAYLQSQYHRDTFRETARPPAK